MRPRQDVVPRHGAGLPRDPASAGFSRNLPRPLPRAFASKGVLRLVVVLVGCAWAAAQADARDAAQQPREVLAEIRVHGNTSTPESEVLQLSGLTLGQPLDAAEVTAAETRLRKNGRFEAVQIRKRYRSLSETGEVAIIIIVQEHPVQDVPPTPVLGPIRKVLGNGMFLPILSYTDGYGFTYGARASFPDTLGRGSRVSVPLTWGGSKRAAVEVDRPLPRGPFQRLLGGVSISRQTNPFYRLDDDRREVWLGGTRDLARGLRVGLHGGESHVGFGGIGDRVATFGADVTYDTRLDPIFPRNAVYLAAGWDVLDPRRSQTVNRLHTDLRGYMGLVRQAVLSVRLQYARADAPLPAYERYLLGGAGTLRGYRAGSFSGDNLAAVAAELRLPLTSPLSIGRLGVTAFADAGTAYDHGERLRGARFRYGTGGGVFLLVSVFQLNADVGVRPGGGTRFHLSTGLQF